MQDATPALFALSVSSYHPSGNPPICGCTTIYQIGASAQQATQMQPAELADPLWTMGTRPAVMLSNECWSSMTGLE